MFAFEKLPGLPRDRIVEAIAPVLRAHGLAGVELIWRTDGQGRVLQVTLEPAADAAPGGGSTSAAPSEAAASEAVASDAVVSDAVVSEAAEAETSDALPSEAATSDEALAELASENAAAAAPHGGGVTLEVCSKVSRDLSTALDVLELIDGNYRLEVGSPGLERRLYTLADYRRFNGRLAKLKLASAIAGQYVLHGNLGGVDAEDRVLIVADGVEHAVKLEDVRSGQLAIDWQEMGFSPAPRQRAGRRPAAQGRK